MKKKMSTPKENRQELTTALRSGEYRQGNNRLKEIAHLTPTELHCPLGVACEIYLKHHPKTSKWSHSDSTICLFQVGNGAIYKNVLPPIVREFFGISHYQHERIIQMNDMFRKTFDEIADFIEMEV